MRLCAADAARAADVAVVIVGYTAEDEGEYIGSEAFADPRLLATFPPLGDNAAGAAALGGSRGRRRRIHGRR